MRRVPAEIASVLSNLAPAVTIEAELQINRAIIRLLTALKRKEKERVEAEDRLLEEIKSLRFLTTRIIEEVVHFKLRFTPASTVYSQPLILASALPRRQNTLLLINCADYSYGSSRSIN